MTRIAFFAGLPDELFDGLPVVVLQLQKLDSHGNLRQRVQVGELIRGPEPEHTLARVMRSGPLSPEGGTLVALQLAALSEDFWGIEFYSGV